MTSPAPLISNDPPPPQLAMVENEHEPTEMKLLGGKCQKCYGTLPGTVFNPRKVGPGMKINR